jgi:hypothetical protein
MILFSLTGSKWVNFINLKITDFFKVVFSNQLSKLFFCKKKIQKIKREKVLIYQKKNLTLLKQRNSPKKSTMKFVFTY